MQALVLSLRWRYGSLQKSGERFQLCRQQERNGKHIVAPGETLADTFFLGVGVGHGRSELRKQNPLAHPGSRHMTQTGSQRTNENTIGQ